MSTLEPPDDFHVRAVLGWLELGNVSEALAELSHVAAQAHDHPDVLDVRWQIYAHQKDWRAALEIARQMVRTCPQRCSGWIHQSFSLHEMGCTREAYEQLLGAFPRFPYASTAAYNLACYSCQLGQMDNCRKWLSEAIKLSTKKEIMEMALQDRDLEPIRDELKRNMG